MARFQYPVPVLDECEEELISKLTDEYLDFIKPSRFSHIISEVKGIIPQSISKKFNDLTKN